MIDFLETEAQTIQTFSLYFNETEPEVITAKALSEYLFYLRALYGLMLNDPDEISIKKLSSDRDEVFKHIQKTAQETSAKEFFDMDFGDLELCIEGATKNSPFEILITGTIMVLIGAVIISGGEIETEVPGVKFKAKLSPIGDGLAKLKKLFGDN